MESKNGIVEKESDRKPDSWDATQKRSAAANGADKEHKMLTRFDYVMYHVYRISLASTIAFIFTLPLTIVLWAALRKHPMGYHVAAIVALGFLALAASGIVFVRTGQKKSDRCWILEQWSKLTDLSTSRIPRNQYEREALCPLLTQILGSAADEVNIAIKKRDAALREVEKAKSCKIDKRNEIKIYRRTCGKAAAAHKRAAEDVERLHRKYLALWDLFTKNSNSGGLELLRPNAWSPKSWREESPIYRICSPAYR